MTIYILSRNSLYYQLQTIGQLVNLRKRSRCLQIENGHPKIIKNQICAKKTYWQPVTWNQSGAGGEDFERFDHELAKTSWAPHRPQLPGKSGRRPSHQIEPTKCIAMPIFKTIDEMQCSWYTHRCWESSCQGWNQQGPALVEEWQGSICRSWNQLVDTDFATQIFITRFPWSSLKQELQRMSASHRLVGFPLHFAYSDTEAIAEGVRGTGVHLCRFFTPVAKSLDQLHVFQGTGSWVCVGSAGRWAIWTQPIPFHFHETKLIV